MEQYIMYMYIMYTEQYSICYNQNNEDWIGFTPKYLYPGETFNNLK